MPRIAPFSTVAIAVPAPGQHRVAAASVLPRRAGAPSCVCGPVIDVERSDD